MSLIDQLGALDVVRVHRSETTPAGLHLAYDLRDGRTVRVVVDRSIIDTERGPDLQAIIQDHSVRELARHYRRCRKHDDCAEHGGLGRECWQREHGDRLGLLAVPDPPFDFAGTSHQSGGATPEER